LQKTNQNRGSKLNTKYGAVDASCSVCENKNCLINRNLNHITDSNFINNKKDIKCKKGQQFIIEGSPVNGLFFILKGTVKVFRTTENSEF